jgi:hypothetical protein
MPTAIPDQAALMDLLQRDVSHLIALLESLVGGTPLYNRPPTRIRVNPWTICGGIWLFVLTSIPVWLVIGLIMHR